jgi:hypothetical protein
MRQWMAGMALMALAATAVLANEVDGDEDARAIYSVLDRMHEGASKADMDAYLGGFDDGALFVGTAPEEVWSLSQFREFVTHYFARGKGWTYVPEKRTLVIKGDSATVVERLRHARYGECRGVAHMIRRKSGWRILSYGLSFPIPNDKALDVISRIR